MQPQPGVQVAPGVVAPQKRLIDRSQPVGRWANVPPNQTLYVNNLNERLNRDELVKALKHVFGQFGRILDVICYTKIKPAKGQAFVVFDDIASATKALHEMNGFLFYHKPLRVAYSKSKSDVIAKRDGTFRPRPPKKKRVGKGDTKDGKAGVKFKFQGDSKAGVQAGGAQGPKTEAGATKPKQQQTTSASALPPNRILLIQNLPKEATENMVSMLFQGTAGFQKVSLIPGYPGYAYVEYQDQQKAGEAMKSLQGFQITAQNKLLITYAPSS